MTDQPLKLYRKRLIPAECILLKDDQIILQNDDVIITTWTTLNPKITFHHGASCYFLKEGYKVSKFYRSDNTLLYWYCDIVDYEYCASENALIVTDLLADVIVYPDGRYKVLDLDESADALERGIITSELLIKSLRRLNSLLSMIYRDKFDQLQAVLDQQNV